MDLMWYFTFRLSMKSWLSIIGECGHVTAPKRTLRSMCSMNSCCVNIKQQIEKNWNLTLYSWTDCGCLFLVVKATFTSSMSLQTQRRLWYSNSFHPEYLLRKCIQTMNCFFPKQNQWKRNLSIWRGRIERMFITLFITSLQLFFS